jgi:hypothetical protein
LISKWEQTLQLWVIYVSIHKEQHQILEQLEEDHGYKGIDEGTKVHYLLSGIKTNKLNTIKGQILGDPSLQTNFDRCDNLFKAYLEQVANDRSQTFNVSRVAVREDNDKKPKSRRDKGGKWVKNPKDRNCNEARKQKADKMGEEDIKDRYYTPQEYATLSPIQQSKLHKLQENRLTRQGAATLTKLKAKIAELKAACETAKDIDTSDKPASNRDNLALQRKSKGQWQEIHLAPIAVSDFARSLAADEHPTDLDSHADTCVIDKHCLVTHVYDKTVSVTGYDPKLGSMKGMQIIAAALAYVDPSSGETLILRAHQAVHIPTMSNNLLCPMQMRLNDVIVDDCSQ